MFLGYFLLAIAFACALIWPRSKWAALGILLFMFIIYGFSSFSGDSEIYELVYKNVGQGKMMSEFEPAFTLIMLLCNALHMPFLGFRIVLAVIYLALLYRVVNKYTNCPAMVLFIVLLFPFTYFFSVLRAGLSGIIILLGVDHLVKMKKLWILKFLIYVVIAALFHYSAIIFLPLILVTGRKRKSTGFIFISILLAVLVYVLFNMGTIYKFLSIFTNRGKILSWVSFENVTDRSNTKGIIGSLLVVVANIALMIFANRIYDKAHKTIGYDLNSYPARLANVTKYINIIMIIICPFLFITSVYLRFIWVVLPLNFCVLVNAAELLSIQSVKTGSTLYKSLSFNSLPIIAYSALLFIFANLPYAGTDIDGFLIFKNNYILNFLGM